MFFGSNSQNTPSFADSSTVLPVFLNPPKEHDASDVPDDPKLVNWVTTNMAVAQNP